MSDFVLILSSLYCWLFGGSALAWDRASKKEKTRASSWFQGKVTFLKIGFLPTFMTAIDIFLNGID